jgi:hypothetical protein
MRYAWFFVILRACCGLRLIIALSIELFFSPLNTFTQNHAIYRYIKEVC